MPRYSSAVLDALPLAGAEWEAMQVAARAALALDATGEPWAPYPHQIAPPGDWDLWLLLAGRGAGKTDAAAAYTNEHMTGPPCLPGIPGGHRAAIIAPTLGDATEACVNGPSGLRAHNSGVRLVSRMGGTFVVWPNGSEAKLFGAYGPEDVERLRAGGNRCMAWCEELMAWAKLDQCWDHLQFGLRLGPHPRAVASTTPKPRKLLQEILSWPTTAVTRATTDDNPKLGESYRRRLERYRGTRLGRQEIGGEILTDVPGALWTFAMLDDRRPAPADRPRCVVAVDPSGGSSPEHDEQGIIAACTGADGRGYVLADRSCKLSPDGWGRRAVQLYLDVKADAIVGEANYGGDMVEAVVKNAARDMGVSVVYKAVHASRGKAVRAAPVAQLYEQGNVSHCEAFAEMEEELTSWTPESGRSPNRLDALVWALTDLLVKDQRSVYVY
ncbi:MAG: terminase large subunit domain-containing protein [Chloroflexota bacterium]|jgi:phage terminase large subunit-like protein